MEQPGLHDLAIARDGIHVKSDGAGEYEQADRDPDH
jgi:hypothetical protein